MEIDKIQAKIRPRSSWEAMDLGFQMVRSWWKSIYLPLVIVSLPIFIVLCLIFHKNPGWAFFGFWWIKPILDKIILYVASRELFAERISVGRVIKLLPSFIFIHIIKFLTFYRLSPSRSFNLPVWQLEGLKGARRANRASLLKRSSSNNTVSLTIACMVIELAVNFVIAYAIFQFIPKSVEIPWTETLDIAYPDIWFNQWANSKVALISFYLSVIIVEPFYVCAGFAVYLNRRTDLEAWDIEIAFRNLAARIKKIKEGRVALSAFLAIGISCFLLGVYSPSAEASSYCKKWQEKLEETSGDESKQAIRKVLSDEDFEVCIDEEMYIPESQLGNGDYTDDGYNEKYYKKYHDDGEGGSYVKGEEGYYEEDEVISRDGSASLEEKGKEHQYKRNDLNKNHSDMPEPDKEKIDGSKSDKTPRTNRDSEKQHSSRDSEFYSEGPSTSLFGGGLEIALWLLLGAVVIFLLIQIFRYRSYFSRSEESSSGDEDSSQKVFGMDVKPKSLPKRLPQKVIELWKEEKYEEAVSLLYRGALAGVIYEYGVEITDDMTEGGCQQAVRFKLKKDISTFFRNVTNMWLKVAYAHSKPEFEELQLACSEWNSYFKADYED